MPDGGSVSTTDGAISISATVGSQDLVFSATTTSTATDLNYWYIITDADDNILTTVDANDNRNNSLIDAIQGAPVGECHVWGWSYSGLEDPVNGANISSLDDNICEDISENWITVIRSEECEFGIPEGGRVSTIDGEDFVAGVTGSDQVVFYATTSSTIDSLSYWYIITDVNDNILTSIKANDMRDSALIDVIQGAPSGECHVWGWSHRGQPDPVPGESVFTLGDDDCEDLSDNFITVVREMPDGGRVYTTMGKDTVIGDAGSEDVVFYVNNTGGAFNLSYWYIITDVNDNILTWISASEISDSTLIDAIQGAPAGVCHVWGWSYRGLSDPIPGENISTLNDDFRETISENWITVVRNEVTGTNDFNNIENFSVFPNPFISNLSVYGDNITELRIYSMDGRNICSIKANVTNLELGFLTSGIYILEAIDNQGLRAIDRLVKN